MNLEKNLINISRTEKKKIRKKMHRKRKRKAIAIARDEIQAQGKQKLFAYY